MVLHLIAPDEQTVVRHADDFHGLGGDERAVEEGGDAG